MGAVYLECLLRLWFYSSDRTCKRKLPWKWHGGSGKQIVTPCERIIDLQVQIDCILCADLRENIPRSYNVACWVGGEKNHGTGAVDFAYYNLPSGKFRS